MKTLDPRALPPGGGRIRLDLGSPTAELVVDHPERRNAVTPGMMVQLGRAVERLEAWPGSVVLLRGEGGRAFCAGGDLEAVRNHLTGPAAGDGMCAYMQGVLGRLASLPLVVLAAVEGPALGGGAELLTACDLVVADDDATIGFVHASLGVSPGWGGGTRLVRRVGGRRALQVLALARRLTAREALDIGIVDEVVPRGTALGRARDLAHHLAGHPPEAVRAAVSVARTADLDHERRLFVSLWGAPAHRDALSRLPAGRSNGEAG